MALANEMSNLLHLRGFWNVICFVLLFSHHAFGEIEEETFDLLMPNVKPKKVSNMHIILNWNMI
jgi:hypothetical protein